MSKLSFVALSLQTTHLDPASVSKASYAKLVDGNITRQDTLTITPAAKYRTSEDAASSEGMTWHEALNKLSMMIGKLPIVSYYRDADKEIFQAASHQFEIEPPEFHWLDCRELARTLLPDLPDAQLSTVLKHLDLYDDYVDHSAVEQTTQIVLELAQRQGAQTVEQLWDQLYDHPDDFLGFETRFEGVTTSAGIPITGDSARTPAAAMLPLANTSTAETEQPHDTTNQTPEQQTVDEQDSQPVEPDTSTTASDENTSDEDVEPNGQESSVEAQAIPEFLQDYDEQTEENATETVQEDENTAPVEPAGDTDTVEDEQEVPEFLQESDSEVIEHQPQADEQQDGSETVASLEENENPTDIEGSEPADDAAETQENALEADSTSRTEPQTETGQSQENTATDVQTHVEATETTPEDAQVVAVEVAQRTAAEPTDTVDRKPGRLFAAIGLVVFSIATIVGIILTVMAVMLFFTPGTLLLETKIAGVILTGAITLLSFLLCSISYRRFRRKT